MTNQQMREFHQAREEIGRMRDAARITPAGAARDALLAQIRRTLAEPDRASLRKAKDDRAHALRGFKSAMDRSQRWVAESVGRYVGALSAEAAANRAEARHVRDLLTAFLALYERETRTPMMRDTEEEA